MSSKKPTNGRFKIRAMQIPLLQMHPRLRIASTKLSLVLILGSIVLMVCLIAALNVPVESKSDISKKTTVPLIIYCAASNKGVLEVIRKDYERDTGKTLQIQYGPSQTLLASAEISKSGDLYLPADDSYLAIARTQTPSRTT